MKLWYWFKSTFYWKKHSKRLKRIGDSLPEGYWVCSGYYIHKKESGACDHHDYSLI